ncbi:flagellar hook protein FlgE [Thermotoga caldifontis]|uniref:flagellar hook protein FlgE n=1 Tax=Thermotoga caldifontis TaxID=1508419 RepID=UPI000597A962|nr:flagellar hook protein FlgE [Thermotoga caldifontis]
MMRSMFSGVSGMRNFQYELDVIGNNISNVNTVGFKGSRVTFQTALLQTLKAARAPQNNIGGTNPIQIGLGSQLATVDKVMTQGSFQNTGRKLDLAIQGDGFFVLGDGRGYYYTRAGALDVDMNGTLIHASTGLKVQGWRAVQDPATGSRYVDTNQPIGDIVISAGMTMPARATTAARIEGNLNSTSGILPFSMTVTDDGGKQHTVRFVFSKTEADIKEQDDPFAENQRYTWTVYDENNDEIASGYIVINQFGRVVISEVLSGGAGSEITAIGGGANITIPTAGEIRFYESDNPSNFVTAQFNSPRYVTAVQVYDTLGNPYSLHIEFIRLGKFDTMNNAWIWRVYTASGEPITYIDAEGDENYAGGIIDFNDSGRITAMYGFSWNGTDFTVGNTELRTIRFDASHMGDGTVTINLDLTALTQFAGANSASFTWQNGNALGALQSFAINENGEIIGTFSNGLTDILGQIALAVFNNPAGLTEVGNSLYLPSANSGLAQIGTAGSGGRGTLIPGALEMSNVDLAEEFTRMIIAQRGFQANARVITTADTILGELVALRR